MAAIDLPQWDKSLDDPKSNKQELYDQMKSANGASSNGQYLWRLTKNALMLSDLAIKNKKKDLDKKMVFESLEWAKKALEVDPDSVDSHKWYCAAVGRMAPHVSTKERIQFGHEFKKHSDIATAINPNDQLMHHMYGRWCYEVASLTWVEKKIAATFFGTPPESTFADSYESLMKAHQLKPIWITNKLWIAKALIAEKKYAEAMQWIDEGLAITPQTEDDFVSNEELTELEKKYSKHRK